MAFFTEILAHLLGFMPISPRARPAGSIRSPDEIHPISLHLTSLEITIIDTLGHAQDGFYARYDQSQNGQSNNQ